MKIKMMVHYAVSFFLAALVLIVINILYMQSSVYQDDGLYHFDSSMHLDFISAGISIDESGAFQVSANVNDYLLRHNIGIQIIDASLSERLKLNAEPYDLENVYSLESLYQLYQSKIATTFAKTLDIDGTQLTLLMVMSPTQIKRTVYTYDVKLVESSYNIFWLVGMNIALLVLISYIYTYNISRPIYRINGGIIKLSEGAYNVEFSGKGLYKEVEMAMNALAIRLEHARNEQRLSDISREEWISNLSHDIRTPLTSLIGYGELLADPEYPPSVEEKKKYIEIITSKGAYIENLLDDLNMATRLKHNQLPLKFESIELVSEMKEILIDILNTKFSEHNITFTHSHESIIAEIDRRLFKRALVNLVYNAFVHNKGTVSVKVHVDMTETEGIKITIEDDGVGVEKEERSKIFSRYYRGTHTTNDAEGSGLGLAIAHDIITAHGGELTADQSSLGGLKLMIKIKSSEV
ncbi:MAG TPA: hypothetical protein DCS67_02585 [Clostridiales bacterium UBA8960]|nr:hypothetical protein [Clostridiales bacterium UBA8960]